MSRIDELHKRYPAIPRDVILKHDVMVQGVRASGGLDKASDWSSESRRAYQTLDYDGSLRDLVDKEPWRAKGGLVLRPPRSMRFKSGLGAQIRLRSTAPYTVAEASTGKFALYEGEDKVDDICFVRRRPRIGPEPVTNRGTPISHLMDLRPSCFFLVITSYCQFFSTGQQCKFCNYNAGHADTRSVGLDVPTTVNLEEAAEAFEIRSSERPQMEGGLMMGSFVNTEQEAKLFLRFVGKLATIASWKPNLTVHGKPMDRKNMQRLKDAGTDSFALQLEVMDRELFEEICPGKAKQTPYDLWLQALLEAVDVFGAGNVGGKLVPGVTLLSPNGHKTWQEARDHSIEANRWMIRNGILPASLPLWWAPGSVYGSDRSHIEKFPPTEYHLEVAWAHHRDMLQYGLYEKMNKFMYCGLDTTVEIYGGDIGMLTLAGDVGKWMSNAVPPEANWVAKLVASMKGEQCGDFAEI